MKKLICFIGVVALLCFNMACTQTVQGGVQSSISEIGDIKNIKIITDNCDIKSSVSPDSETIDKASKNSVLDVISKVQDWYAVKLSNNEIGFVPEKESTPVVVDDKKAQQKTDTSKPTQTTVPEKNASKTTTPKNGNVQQNTPAADNNEDDNANKVPEIPTENTSGSLTEMEQQMVNLVNQSRQQNGLAPLSVYVELTNVARIKSQDMIDNNYFSHNSPTYGSPFDMMKDFGISYVHAGENIAGNQSVQNAHDSLMNSPGHRKNILSPDYTHIGIGIKEGGSYGRMFTQMFVSKPK